MLDTIFKGLFDSELASVISLTDFLLCLAVSLVLGILLAIAFAFRARYTKSFVMTLALLPAIVCVVIMMVNGNIGTGVAVAGASGALLAFADLSASAEAGFSLTSELSAKYEIDSTISLPQGVFSLNGKEYPAETIVYYPNGYGYSTNEVQ